MKKNVISLAVATSVAALGTAAVQAQTAMYLNPEKTGQVLLFPFYDAENGNATNFHVVNTTKKAKAVKIRFREYKASREVLDFNLYLSAEDHFAFGVIMDPNGTGGAIITMTILVRSLRWAHRTTVLTEPLRKTPMVPLPAFSPS